MERILAQHFFWLKYLLFRWYSLHKKAVMQIVIIQYGLSHITFNKISQFICKYWNRVKFKLEWTGGKFPKVKKVWYFISMFIVTNHYQIRLFSFISTIELFLKICHTWIFWIFSTLFSLEYIHDPTTFFYICEINSEYKKYNQTYTSNNDKITTYTCSKVSCVPYYLQFSE